MPGACWSAAVTADIVLNDPDSSEEMCSHRRKGSGFPLALLVSDPDRRPAADTVPDLLLR